MLDLPPPTKRQADVIIIGAGATGALAAVALAEKGLSVIVLEKGGRLGYGASSRSAACIRAQFDDPQTVLGMMYAEWFYGNFFELLQVPPPDGRPSIITRSGYLFLYEQPFLPGQEARQHMLHERWIKAQADASVQQQLGLPVEILLDGEEVRQRWPHLNPERIVGATWCAEDGFLEHDQVYLSGFQRAQALGAQIYLRTEVAGATLTEGRIIALHTSQGDFSSEWVVNATNAWAPRLSPKLGGASLPITPVKRYLYHVAPDSRVFRDGSWKSHPMTIYGMTPDRLAYSRPHHGTIMYGLAHNARPEPDFTDEDQDVVETKFRDVDNGYWLEIRFRIEAFSETMANPGRPNVTGGYYDDTPDHHPIIDVDPQVANLVHAVGFSGHGLMLAPVTALLVSAIISSDHEDGQVFLPEIYPGNGKLSLKRFSLNRDFSTHLALYL